MSTDTQAPVTHPHANLPEGSMVDSKIRVCGIDLNYKVPATVGAFDALAKKEGAALAQANKQQLFHGSYGDIRGAAVAKLVKDGVGTPRLMAGRVVVTEVLDEKGEVTSYSSLDGEKTFKADAEIKVETDNDFIKRICAEQNVEPSHFQSLFQEVADANPFDPSRKARASGNAVSKVAKAYIEAAQGIIDGNNGENAAAMLSDALDRIIDLSDAETAVMTLATAISDNELKEKREREAALKNKYASYGA